MRLGSKQLTKRLEGNVALSGFTANGGSGNISSAIATVLASAGDGGGQVPTQASSSGGVGVLTTSPDNRAEIYDSASKLGIDDGNGNDVYGRVTFASPVYTITFYSIIAGVETAFSFGANTNIDIEFGYVFDLVDLPTNAIRAQKVRRVSDDPAGSTAGTPWFEVLTPTADWTIPNLSYAPKNTAIVKMTCNGQAFYAGAHFTITGQAISFSSGQKTAIGFTVTTTDTVYFEYNK